MDHDGKGAKRFGELSESIEFRKLQVKREQLLQWNRSQQHSGDGHINHDPKDIDNTCDEWIAH